MGEIIFLLVLGCVGGYYYHESLTYTVTRFERTGGAAIFPRALIYVLCAFILIRILQILASRQKSPFKVVTIFKGPRGVFFLSFVAFVALMDILGFAIAGSLYLICISFYMDRQTNGDSVAKSPKRLFFRSLLMVASVLALGYLFSNYLHVRIPAGVLKSIL
ncbi:MAG: tripartite tricarboxylate transporter TctB family protein [Planctomycetota bacterium]|jgi:hypothetical protein|nr:tripartite tricarboxylate transporter TctB family protein [Planctomycetota bacterium]